MPTGATSSSACRPCPVHPGAAPAARPVSFGWTDVLASISDGVIVLDVEGVVSDLNPAAEQLTGVAALAGRRPRRVERLSATARRTRGSPSSSRATLGEAVTHRRPRRTALRVRGREVVVSAACAPVLDAAGRAAAARCSSCTI